LAILGGMSWTSTELYYRLINTAINQRRGRQNSAELVIASPNVPPLVDAMAANDWPSITDRLTAGARTLESNGAKAFLLASNTMHIVYESIQKQVAMTGLSIIAATSANIKAKGLQRVGLLGTRYTMNHAFFDQAYRAHGIELIKPSADDRSRVNDIIFKDLIRGVVRPESVAFYKSVIERLTDAGAQGVILGCTEISLLFPATNSSHDIIPLFDTTLLHAEQAVAWLLQR